MRLLLLAAAFFIIMPSARAAGLQRLEVPADATGRTLAGAVWSPCARPPGLVRLRRVTVHGVRGCPVNGTRLPLVVISHGYNGWFGGHHTTAAALADAGFVVAAITHPNERSRRWVFDRPADIRRLIDHMLESWPGRARLDPDRIGFYGFSRGGYTGLVAIGGVPDFGHLVRHCESVPTDPVCPPFRRWQRSPPHGRYTHHRRISAAVIAAPLGAVFGRKSLQAVSVPVRLWRAERDERLKYPHHAEAVARALPHTPDYQIVPAGHFVFLAPCSAGQARAAPAICRDEGGFDRGAFHWRLNASIIAFFRKHLR